MHSMAQTAEDSSASVKFELKPFTQNYFIQNIFLKPKGTKVA